MKILQWIGLKSLPWWYFSTSSKVSIGGLTLNLESITQLIPLIITCLSLPPLCSWLLSCSFSVPELTNKNSPTSSTWRRSPRKAKDKRTIEPRLRTKLNKRPKPLPALIEQPIELNWNDFHILQEGYDAKRVYPYFLENSKRSNYRNIMIRSKVFELHKWGVSKR